ncbi:testis-expressed protein 9-like [Mizuhopecten yessoensis]|uniref:Testis-expressed sequence 9 protein n=1 Tax=Mizuhopecten yessoensis TaxID=6573 RepID=A0A210QKQ1_MIZYE|nr:testis-expressed protein 9-like [Mizuhopecten yessoensis]OWF49322.1 Testis-expressed sequence 9 protein [Mizuhopecten yessoensis]
MADSGRHSASKPGRRSGSGVKNTNLTSGRNSSSIQSKEEEYKRLNAELEAKTANLVREAEEVLKDQDAVFSQSSLLDNINTDEFLDDYDEEIDDRSSLTPQSRSGSKLTNQNRSSSSTSQNRPISANQSRPNSGLQSRPNSKTKKTGSARSRGRSAKSNVSDNVAVPEEAFITECKEFSKQTILDTITNIEERLDTDDDEEEEDDIIPQAAADMGSEATIRFLKAKLRVMQEELDRLAQDCNKKDEENNSVNSRIKELEDERGRLHRTNASQQTQIDKYKRMAEDARTKSESSETQLVALRKELEQMKRSQKQQSSSQSATEVRLNRALEEIEKQKEQLLRSKSSSKESTEQEKHKVDQLLSVNKRLEKQKNELMAGFKKQLKLIDILKRQKMHIEAAKMLSFSEEEFVKALEWGS